MEQKGGQKSVREWDYQSIYSRAYGAMKQDYPA